MKQQTIFSININDNFVINSHVTFFIKG